MKAIFINKTEEDIIKTPQAKVAIVGGWARDKLLGIQSRDIDIIVHSSLFNSFLIGFEQFLSDQKV